ncbi:MAG TPA: hypothetical protein VM619_14775 [Luteimonas sp.]|nr:hypothetical protein [Luteimonas sp.]
MKYKLRCRICGDTGEMCTAEVPAGIVPGQAVDHVETVCERCPNDGLGERAVAAVSAIESEKR